MSTASQLTPELLDLMEHEKAIEQGLAAVGWHLQRIRDGRKYRAAGFATFEDYCQERWSMGRSYVNRQIRAAEVIAEIEERMVPIGTIPTPEREAQVRPLHALPDPDERAEAWRDAVESAGGEQPTAREVTEAVARRQPPKKDHPAPYSDDILERAAEHLRETGATGTVLDPFAGTGRVHELRERAGVDTVGVEIEPEWAAKHPDTIEGNALELTATFEPGSVDAIVTSPTYGNRMADHHQASDDSVRLTYKHTLGRDLALDNSGQMQWGDEYRAFHERAWTESVAVLKPGGTLTLNIKNHIRAGEIQRVAEWHVNTLFALGLRLVALDIVPTRGLMAGANAETRTVAEFVMTFRKADVNPA